MSTLYQYETHLHTSNSSACGGSTATEQVEAHYQAGYAGFVITDHFFNGNCAIDSNLPWAKRVKAFCAAYHEAQEAAKHLEFDVFFGFELSFSGMDFLVYGIEESFLLNNEAMMDLPMRDFLTFLRENGGFVIHAHPFREAFYIPEIILVPDCVDGVEVVNLANGGALEPSNQKAYAYAKEHGLYQTKGTDIHYVEQIQGGGMAFKERVKSMAHLIQMIKEQNG